MIKKGDLVILTDEALDNYGAEWENVKLRIVHIATKYMPAEQFFRSGMPEGYHPGYDSGVGLPLYDLELEDGTDFDGSLYDWEVEKI